MACVETGSAGDEVIMFEPTATRHIPLEATPVGQSLDGGRFRHAFSIPISPSADSRVAHPDIEGSKP